MSLTVANYFSPQLHLGEAENSLQDHIDLIIIVSNVEFILFMWNVLYSAEQGTQTGYLCCQLYASESRFIYGRIHLHWPVLTSQWVRLHAQYLFIQNEFIPNRNVYPAVYMAPE